MSKPVTIIMIEDDEGHARLIERNIRRSGVNNDIIPFTNGTEAVNYLFGSDGTGLDHKGNALLILLDLNLPDIVSDRLALEQIFSNLIDNALKYLKPGVPGDITVRGRTKLGFAIFEVADNGRGIDPKDHQRIFDLFRRAGTQDKPGQGIGLAHVRALVRRLGGTMSVASELHGGSTFTITLPIQWAASNRNRDS